MAPRFLKGAVGLAAMVALIWVGACAESGPGVTEAPDLDILMAPPSQSPDPDPQSVAPDSVLQATTDTLIIGGEYFEPGDQVGWLLNGKGTDDIVTMSSQVVDSATIIAIVEVAADAELTTFDVEVRGGGKRKGIGTDLLRVETNPGQQSSLLPAQITVNSTVNLATDGDQVFSDDDGCAFAVVRDSETSGLRVELDPNARAKGKKAARDCPALSAWTSVGGADDVSDLRFRLGHATPGGAIDPSRVAGTGTINVPEICGSSSGLRFNPGILDENGQAVYSNSTGLEVSTLPGGGWQLRSPAGGAVGGCLDQGTGVVTYHSMDISIDVVLLPS